MGARLAVKSGQLFNYLKVILEAENRGDRRFLCECTYNKCGNQREYRLEDLRSGNTKSCGCLQKAKASARATKVKKGDKYGGLTILKEVAKHVTPGGQQQRQFECKCVACGGKKILKLAKLQQGQQTCGCDAEAKHREATIKSNKARPGHRLSKHPLYGVWAGMKDRCYNKNSKDYPRWGGRGITICRDWRNHPERFIRWSEQFWQPGLTIDREDNNGNYEPSNCRFVTVEVQNNNQRSNVRYQFQGEFLTANQIARKVSLNISTLKWRLAHLKKGQDIYYAVYPKAKDRMHNR